MFVTSDFACFDLQSTSDFSLIRRSISEKSKQAQMILPQGFSTIFGAFSLSGLAFPAGSTVLQNDLASVMVRCDRKTQNPVVATPYRFDPDHRHHPESLVNQGFRDFLFFASGRFRFGCVFAVIRLAFQPDTLAGATFLLLLGIRKGRRFPIRLACAV